MSPHDGLFVPSSEPQGTASPARHAQGTLRYEGELLRLRSELETWRALAEERGRKLDTLMIALNHARAELEAFPARLTAEIERHVARLAAEHDRS